MRWAGRRSTIAAARPMPANTTVSGASFTAANTR